MHCIQKLGLLGISLVTIVFDLPAIAQTNAIPTTRLCQKDLGTKIEEIVNAPQYERLHWGIQIKTLQSKRILYSLNSDKYIIPASNAKLLTAAALISELGNNYRIETPIYSLGKPPDLDSLRVVGRGDPSLSTQDLESIVRQLQLQGVKTIKRLIVDDGYFDTPKINPTWEWSDIYSYYATSVNSLILDRNTVTLTLLPQELGQPVKIRWQNAIAARQWQIDNRALTAPKNTSYNIEIIQELGKPTLNIRGELAENAVPDIWDLAVVDPARYFLDSFWILLEKEGIDVIRGEIAKDEPFNILETKKTSLLSPYLAEAIVEINQNSNNLYAEVLAEVLRKEMQATNKIEAIAISLSKLGIEREKYHLVDASGLSRHNLLTPEVLVEVLETMATSKYKKVYQNSLAVAGRTGTLKNRFNNTNITANLWGKTGTLTGVATLSGYFNLPNYEPLIFTITINNSKLSSRKLRKVIDEIVLVLSYLHSC